MQITIFASHHAVKGAMLLGVFLAGLLLFYIFQINALTKEVYYMGDQEKRLGQLKEQSILFEAVSLPIFSRTRMEELAQKMEFERVEKVSYIKVLSSSVATTKNQ